MIDNLLHIVFPWYQGTDAYQLQNHRRAWCFDDICTFKLITGRDRLLPFQIRRTASAAPLVTMTLYCMDDTVAAADDLLDCIPAGDIEIEVVSSWEYIIYYGNQDLTCELPCGTYYLALTDGTITWYSEVFTVEDITDSTIDTYRTTDDGTTLRTTGTTLRIVT